MPPAARLRRATPPPYGQASHGASYDGATNDASYGASYGAATDGAGSPPRGAGGAGLPPPPAPAPAAVHAVHGHLTRKMVENADILVGYKT